MTTAILLQLLLPLTIWADLNVKFRYVTSMYADDKGIALKQPEGLACDDKSHLIAADTANGRLVRYTFKEGALEAGAGEIKVDQLPYPTKMKINSKGEIYVLDRKQRRIARLAPSGEFLGYFNPSGLPSTASYVIRSFDTDINDNFFILDILSERVLVLDPQGKYEKQIDFPKQYGFFSDVAVDFKGTVLLIDSVNGVIFSAEKDSARFSPLTESLKEYVRFPASLTTDDRGRIYLVDRNGGSIIILGQNGAFLGRQSGMGWKEGRLRHPSQLCLNNKGEVFIADTSNNRIQIFVAVE